MSSQVGQIRFRACPLLLALAALAVGCPKDRGDSGAQDAGGAGKEDAGQDAGGCREARPLRCGDRLSGSTALQGLEDAWSAYGCTQRAETGPETVYAFRADRDCRAAVRLTGIEGDLDLLRLEACDPWRCGSASSTPIDIQEGESVAFTAEAGRDCLVAVDGYDGASGAYVIEADCLCGSSARDFADGAWELRVDRRWNGSGAALPSDTLDEGDYETADPGTTYAVEISGGWGRASIGETPLLGERTAGEPGTLTYDLVSGSFAGGRFVVRVGETDLEAELTIYGSGVPIVSSERGVLVPASAASR